MTHTPSQAHFIPTRAEALHRLDAFLPRSGSRYAADRNDDPGPQERGATSVLSPYLRRRMIDERELLAAVLDAQGPARAEKFVQEVCWRTYFKGYLQAHPHVWDGFLDGRERDRDRLGSGGAKALARAEEGRTGIDGFDDWARELVETGWLHNHARMWFSSIWIFTLRLPWTLGADFFLRHLVDGDPASNTLSWRWTAGLHTRGKTYLATADNIARYTGGRFRPEGLATRAEALDEPMAPKPRPLPEPEQAGRPDGTLLLVTDEDLSPDWLAHEGERFAGVAVARTLDVGQGGERGRSAASFADEALADAADRLGALARDGRVEVVDLTAEAVSRAATSAGAGRVVSPFAPVGATASALDRLAGELDGVALARPMRAWDRAFWPHAGRGYGGVRAKIPELLGQAGLPAG